MKPHVSAYLAGRGLSGRVPEALLEHPALEYWEGGDKPVLLGKFPAMVAEILDHKGETVALHQTFLDPETAQKAHVPSPKKVTTPTREGALMGAAIRLAPPQKGRLGLAEGIETALAVTEATGIACWSTIAAGGLARFRIPEELAAELVELTIWTDNDPSQAGVKAARELKERLKEEFKRLRVRILLAPHLKTDWLDALIDYGPERLALAAAQGQDPERHGCHDVGNARRLVERHGRDLRFDHNAKTWFLWTGKVWKIDRTAEIDRRAVETAASIGAEAALDPGRAEALLKHALRSQSRKTIRAMVDQAASEPSIPVLPDAWDADPWLLNCPNGVVDLRNGRLKPHRRADMHAKITLAPYIPDAPAPRWAKFLEEITGGDEELALYLQAVAGYTLTGDRREDCFFLHYGAGRNGKGVFFNRLRKLLGDYAQQSDPSTFSFNPTKTAGNTSPEIARLQGVRLCITSEADEGVRLAESMIKQLTGRDPLVARLPYERHPVEFEPICKLHFLTNHKPTIRGTDNGIWSRVRLVPWLESFEGREDKTLESTLKREYAGILAWAVDGAVYWHDNGLPHCQKVVDASREYRHEMDVLGQFIADCLGREPGERTTSSDLYQAYQAWAKKNGHNWQLTAHKFAPQMQARGFKKEKIGGLIQWLDMKVYQEL